MSLDSIFASTGLVYGDTISSYVTQDSGNEIVC